MVIVMLLGSVVSMPLILEAFKADIAPYVQEIRTEKIQVLQEQKNVALENLNAATEAVIAAQKAVDEAGNAYSDPQVVAARARYEGTDGSGGSAKACTDARDEAAYEENGRGGTVEAVQGPAWQALNNKANDLCETAANDKEALDAALENAKRQTETNARVIQAQTSLKDAQNAQQQAQLMYDNVIKITGGEPSKTDNEAPDDEGGLLTSMQALDRLTRENTQGNAGRMLLTALVVAMMTTPVLFAGLDQALNRRSSVIRSGSQVNDDLNPSSAADGDNK